MRRDRFPAMELFQPVWSPGVEIIRSLQVAPALFGPMRVVSWLGEESFFILFIAFLFAVVRPSLAVRLLVLLIVSNYINQIGKWVFHGPRPYWLDATLTAAAIEKSYGVPSGHAQNAMAMWGFLSMEAARRFGKPAFAAGTVLILLICVSRMVLAVHFPHDILMGLAIGALLLFAFAFWEMRFSLWADRAPPLARVGVPAVAAGFMIGLAVLVRMWLSGMEDPSSWAVTAALRGPAYAIAPREFDTAAITAGIMCVLGLVRTRPYIPAAGWKAIAAFLIITGGILGIRAGLGLIRVEDEVLSQLLRFLRYAGIALWGFYAAPLLLVRLGLMNRQSG